MEEEDEDKAEDETMVLTPIPNTVVDPSAPACAPVAAISSAVAVQFELFW